MRNGQSVVRVAMGVALTLLLAFVVSPHEANADSSELHIGGKVYGAESGLVQELEQVEVTPGNAEVIKRMGGTGFGVAPNATWGSSYATSTETAQIYYTGKAKAAANVYAGKRIVQVCIWYSRGGTRVSGTACSNANSARGYWVAGPEVETSAWDTLDWNAPKTIFNISTSRINPGVI